MSPLIFFTHRILKVKSGGHAYSLGFSSTTGVQISLRRLNSFSVNNKTKTVTLGTGLKWDEAYQLLEPYGVNVAGARIPGVGKYLDLGAQSKPF